MKNKIYKLNKIFILTLIISLNINIKNYSLSVEPNEILKDSILENRARQISKNIRCVICQNQSIDESNSILAKDLRILVRKKLQEGYKDKEIYNFLAERYGDFILLKPPLILSTIGLWFLPLIFIIIGFFVIITYNSKPKK
jgi:cytochrome c-type biogenesis protein CcmH|tara:strand:- start:568 stop:990 length:423 start_codon:yes stop_codon:yes gene_type:complete